MVRGWHAWRRRLLVSAGFCAATAVAGWGPAPEAAQSRAVAGSLAEGGGAVRVLPGTQLGLASYYARRFEGRRTASGTTFDNDKMVAAHPSYPFGTVLRVTNLRNRKTVDVTVVDRGPAREPRARGVIIDLSRAAADALDFIRAGRTRVRLEVRRLAAD